MFGKINRLLSYFKKCSRVSKVRSMYRNNILKVNTLTIKSQSKTLQTKPVEYSIDSNGCWICTSHACTGGYPYITLNFKRRKLSRVVYELFKGPIPPNMIVMHSCDNPQCINPDHLKIGTHKQNTQDMIKKRRNKFGINHKLAKLNDELVRYIRQSNKGCTTLAKELGVSKTLILKVRWREVWTHIE